MLLQLNDQKAILAFIKKHHLNITISDGWQNFSRNNVLPDALVLAIDDIDSLAALQKKLHTLFLARLKKEGASFSVRIAAGGNKNSVGIKKEYSESYSFTAGAAGDVILHLTGDAFQTIGFSNDDDKAKNIITVGGSVQVGDLDKTLWKLGLITPTCSLIPYVTIAGLLANAGIGTGKNQPAYAGLVESMTLMLENGEIVVIDKNNPDFTTICGAHLGLFGTVLNVRLQCQPGKKLEYTRIPATLAELIQQIKEGALDRADYFNAIHIPTYDYRSANTVKDTTIYFGTPIGRQEKKYRHDVNNHITWSHFAQELEIDLEEGLRITDFVNAFPDLIPPYMKYIVARTEVSKETSITRGAWPDVLHYQTAFPHKINDIDWLIPVSDDAHEAIQVLEKLDELLQAFAAKKKYPIGCAVYLRYLKGTNGGLSTSSHKTDKHIFSIDIASTPGAPGYTSFRKVWNEFCLSMNGKPHWGKDLPDGFDVKAVYGKNVDATLAARQRLYEQHALNADNSMLCNAFADNILHPTPTPTIQKPAKPLIPSDKIVTYASVIHAKIEGESDAANDLRAALIKVKERYTYSKQAHMTFAVQPQPPLVEVKTAPTSKACCIIL